MFAARVERERSKAIRYRSVGDLNTRAVTRVKRIFLFDMTLRIDVCDKSFKVTLLLYAFVK